MRWPSTPASPPSPASRSTSPTPTAPAQRPTNENTGGLIREYFPKGTSFTDVTDAQVQAVQDQLKGRPREVLNGQTPTEILDTIINGATTT
nr:hypothetical protein [uncultured Actinomyces sp.]